MTRTDTAAAFAQAAKKLSGARFRLHGRDPATGLDCLGVIAAALRAIGREDHLPTGYRLRNRSIPDLPAFARQGGFAEAEGAVVSGDVLAVRPHACQLHFLVALGGNRFVHAHAGLARVAITPWLESWALVSHLRLAEAH